MQQTGSVQKVTLEDHHATLLVACLASSLQCRPAQLPLCLSAPSKCTDRSLQSLLCCAPQVPARNHILGRDQCAPSVYLIPSTSFVACSSNAGSSSVQLSWSTSCKSRKAQAAAFQRALDQSGGRQSISGKNLTHFGGILGTKSCGTHT